MLQRAILRIGMLLRDSTVAKEVRTQLLNVFESTTEPQRMEAIDHENTLLLAVVRANSPAESAIALAEYKRYMDRHVAELETKIDNLESQLDLVAKGTLKWGNRPIANALVRAIAGVTHCPVPYTWGRVYREMAYALGIHVSMRKLTGVDTSLIARVREDEWPNVLRLIGSLAHEAGVDIAQCINSVNIVTLQ